MNKGSYSSKYTYLQEETKHKYSGFWGYSVIHLQGTKFYTEDEDSMFLHNTGETSDYRCHNPAHHSPQLYDLHCFLVINYRFWRFIFWFNLLFSILLRKSATQL